MLVLVLLSFSLHVNKPNISHLTSPCLLIFKQTLLKMLQDSRSSDSLKNVRSQFQIKQQVQFIQIKVAWASDDTSAVALNEIFLNDQCDNTVSPSIIQLLYTTFVCTSVQVLLLSAQKVRKYPPTQEMKNFRSASLIELKNWSVVVD